MATKRIDAAALDALASSANELMRTRVDQMDADMRAQFVDNKPYRDALAAHLLEDLAALLGRINDVVDLDEDLLTVTTREV